MDTKQLITELAELVHQHQEDRTKSLKDKIREICDILEQEHHAQDFIASGQKYNRWRTHLSNIRTFTKHPRYYTKAVGAVCAIDPSSE